MAPSRDDVRSRDHPKLIQAIQRAFGKDAFMPVLYLDSSCFSGYNIYDNLKKCKPFIFQNCKKKPNGETPFGFSDLKS